MPIVCNNCPSPRRSYGGEAAHGYRCACGGVMRESSYPIHQVAAEEARYEPATLIESTDERSPNMSNTTIPYTLVGSGEESNISVFIPTEPTPLTAHSDHPNFEKIVAKVLAQDTEGLTDLFDASVAADTKFRKLTERVSVRNGIVYFDGDAVDNSLSSLIVRFLGENVEDWQPLVSFMENIAANPTEHSKEQLFDWLNSRDFTITTKGLIVGYKGVNKNPDGTLVSGFSGSAVVDGEPKQGRIPNEVGSVVEMPRSSVAWDPSNACSTGLHVGTFDYAKGYANGAMLKVYVNPRDVVSVPTDAAGEKVRVCRYEVVEVIDAPETTAIVYDDYDDEYDLDERDDEGGTYQVLHLTYEDGGESNEDETLDIEADSVEDAIESYAAQVWFTRQAIDPGETYLVDEDEYTVVSTNPTRVLPVR